MEDKVKDILSVCQARRLKGKKVYGNNNFRTKNNIKEAVEELYDTINYLLFQIILLTEMDENLQLQGATRGSKQVREKANSILPKPSRNSGGKGCKKEKEVAKARHRRSYYFSGK